MKKLTMTMADWKNVIEDVIERNMDEAQGGMEHICYERIHEDAFLMECIREEAINYIWNDPCGDERKKKFPYWIYAGDEVLEECESEEDARDRLTEICNYFYPIFGQELFIFGIGSEVDC